MNTCFVSKCSIAQAGVLDNGIVVVFCWQVVKEDIDSAYNPPYSVIHVLMAINEEKYQ